MIDFEAEEAREQRLKEEQARIDARRIHLLRQLLEQPDFREFCWDLLGRSGYFDASFTGDALTTAFREGKRNVGQVTFIDVLTARNDAYTVMRDEAIAREDARRRTLERGETDNG